VYSRWRDLGGCRRHRCRREVTDAIAIAIIAAEILPPV